MSFVGLVGLTGIVVNDSIVLVDCINSKRKQKMKIFVKSCLQRPCHSWW